MNSNKTESEKIMMDAFNYFLNVFTNEMHKMTTIKKIEQEFYTIDEVAKILNLPISNIKKRCRYEIKHKEYIKNTFVSNRYLIHRDELQRWIGIYS